MAVVPSGQSGGSFLPNAPVNWTSATPSTFQTAPNTVGLGDVNNQQRMILNPVFKALTSGSAISLFTVTRVNNSWVGGTIDYLVQVTDGTDYQTLVGMVTYAYVDKGGTGTFTITEVAGNQAKALSAGTITNAWTFVTGTAIGTVKLATTTSLTATVLNVYYSVRPLLGTVTIL
jgi:hypothetical protein